MEKLKELLANECSFRPSGKLLDELLAPAESIELKKNEVLIMSGRLDPNVYIVKKWSDAIQLYERNTRGYFRFCIAG